MSAEITCLNGITYIPPILYCWRFSLAQSDRRSFRTNPVWHLWLFKIAEHILDNTSVEIIAKYSKGGKHHKYEKRDRKIGIKWVKGLFDVLLAG